jgi:hypothetical protein
LALWNVNGQLVNDADEGARIPDNAIRLPEYRNPQNLRGDAFTWDPTLQHYQGEGHTGPDFLPWLLNWRSRMPMGNLDEIEQAEWRKQEEAARAIPTRDIATLTAGWGGQSPEDDDWWTSLNPLSPDAAPIALRLREHMDAGTASAQERQLYGDLMEMAYGWQQRASKPDPWNPLGDQLFGALGTIALGATGGLAGGALAAGGTLASTLGASGTLAGIAGTGASTLGAATGQPWLSKAGQVLGAVGGLAGGAGGLANLWGTGITSLSDAARLASSAGKVTGALGSATGVPGLQQAGSYLGLAGNLGQAGSDLSAGNLGAGVPRLLSVLGQGRGIAQRLAGGQEDAPGRQRGQRPDLVRGPAPTSPPLQAPMPAPMMPPGGGGPQPDGIQRLLAAAQMAQRGAPLPDWRSILMRG